jgi:hypothetical protein
MLSEVLSSRVHVLYGKNEVEETKLRMISMLCVLSAIPVIILYKYIIFDKVIRRILSWIK